MFGIDNMDPPDVSIRECLTRNEELIVGFVWY
jgi:hypothetical protein